MLPIVLFRPVVHSRRPNEPDPKSSAATPEANPLGGPEANAAGRITTGEAEGHLSRQHGRARSDTSEINALIEKEVNHVTDICDNDSLREDAQNLDSLGVKGVSMGREPKQPKVSTNGGTK